MLAKLKRLIPKGKFTRALALISGGSILGNLFLVASSPLLTRLFSPEDFGLLAVFISILSLLSVVQCLRYDFAIPVAETDDEAASLVLGTAYILIASAVLTTILTVIFGDWLSILVKMPSLATVLWLLPPATCIYGFGILFTYWSLRRQTFKLNSASKLVLGAGQAGSQLALGTLAFGAPGLVIGYAAGIFMQVVYLVRGTKIADRQLMFSRPLSEIFAGLKRHWRYPVYYMPSQLMTMSSQLLPPILLAIVYGPALAGLFALGQRVVGMPTRLVSLSASQVFLSEVPKLSPPKAKALFMKTSTRFLALAMVGFVPLVIVGPELFALVFGERWREAGQIVAWLVPLYVTRFVIMAVGQVLNVLNRQHWHLIMASLSMVALIGCFTAAWFYQWHHLTTIAVYSLSWAAIQFATWIVAWRAVSSYVTEPA